MPHGEEVGSTPLVKVDGTQLPTDVESLLVETCVDDSILVPGHFVLRFNDEGGVVLTKAGFKIGAKVEISVQATSPGGPAPLLTGEVTAVEAEGREGALHTVVRGMDVTHRLQRGTQVRAFPNMSASDIVAKIAGELGLSTQIDSTTAVLEHTVQAGESNWDFLRRLAVENNRVFWVADGKLRFVKPPEAGEAPGTTDARQEPKVIEHGVNLVDLRATVTSSGQVSEVEVRGWDPRQKQMLTATRAARATNAETDAGWLPDKLAGAFAASKHLVATSTRSAQAEVDAAADSLVHRVAGGFAEVDGTARGNPELRAGTAVTLAGVGVPFAGRYLLTATRHRVTQDQGYRTSFLASNTSDRSLFGLTDPEPRPDPAFHGLVPAVVTDAKDPENLGRVKIKIPWLSDDYESTWARVVQPGAGKERGMGVVPEVGDEVLVGFAHGDLQHPYVLGGLFNGQDKPLSGAVAVGGSGQVERRCWVSRTGMQVAFEEKSGDEQLVVSTNDGQQKVLLKQTAKGIEIHSEGPVTVVAKQDISMSTDSGSLSLKGTNVTVEASGNLTLKGANAKLEGSANAELSGGAATTVKGGIVRIN